MKRPTILINGGLPRSGTVLVGRVLISICGRAGLKLTRINPAERRDMPELARRIREHQGPGMLLVHTHLTSGEVNAALSARDDVRVFWNSRDPRDSLVSLMRLHEVDLDAGLEAIEVYLHALRKAAEIAILMRYEVLAQDRPGLVRFLAQQVGLTCPPRIVDEIVAETSPEAARGIMNRLSDSDDGTRAIQTLRRVMLEDKQTLITDRHIQSGATGRWREELPADVHGKVNQKLGPWLDLLKYPR